jgi:hypothetical protein
LGEETSGEEIVPLLDEGQLRHWRRVVILSAEVIPPRVDFQSLHCRVDNVIISQIVSTKFLHMESLRMIKMKISFFSF